MTYSETIGAAEAAPFATPRSATQRTAEPCLATPRLAEPGHARPPDSSRYFAKLQRALDRSGSLYLLSDILNALDRGDMQSFAENNSLVVTTINVYPRQKVLNILLAVGDLPDVLKIEPRLIAFAREIGAGVIQSYGRTGWRFEARRSGWKVRSRGCVYCREM